MACERALAAGDIMGINLDKIRERIERLKSKGNTGIYFKPSAGEQDIRIVPVSDEEPFRDFFLHYRIGKEKPFLCPKRQFNEECATCDFASELYQAALNDPTPEGKPNKQLLEEAKKFFAKQRFYSPILARGKESAGIKWWGYSKTINDKLLAIVMKPKKYGDISSAEEGRDIELTYKLPTKKGGYPDISIEMNPNKTTLWSDEISKADCKEMLENIPDIGKDMIRKTSKEVEVIMNSLLEDDDPALNEASKDVEKYGKKQAAKAEQAPKETDDIDGSFKELLKENNEE